MTGAEATRPLVSGFLASLRAYPERPALFVSGDHVSYQELGTFAGRIAATITSRAAPGKLAAVFAHRSLCAYGGVLGVLLAGRGYVPLNPKFPIARTGRMLALSGCNTLVVGQECLSGLADLLEATERPLTVVLPEVSQDEVAALAARFPDHELLSRERLSDCEKVPALPIGVAGDDVAYLMFTSGSTGDPKGVAVSHGNATAYVDFVAARYDVGPDDRLSQTFDLTFDLSVHDMFLSWERGACLCCVPEAMVTAPAKFIRDQSLTLWFSVPSVAGFLSRLRLLRPGLFPSLRFSLFCGEALPGKYAVAWQAAAPNSTLENLYGPTEATIAITAYRWDPEKSAARWGNEVTPIGWAFEGQRTCVVDESRAVLSQGQPGELLLGGSQLTAGYWQDATKTNESFIHLADGKRWYRTGDRVREEADGCLLYLGRIDHQVKVRGYRVELQEIDLALLEVCPSAQVASVAWPLHNGSADGIVAFVSGDATRDEEVIIQRCRDRLPEYMVPRKVRFIEELPRNSNGKIDRRGLAASLDEEKG
ncbi:MAG: amino acid adenylation domain-containing protein [Pseudomonadota bacterium]